MITEILVPADSPVLRHKNKVHGSNGGPLTVGFYGEIVAYRIVGDFAFPRHELHFDPRHTAAEPKLISDEICTLGF